MMENLGFSHTTVHCTPENGCEEQYLIDLETVKDLDQDGVAYSEQFIELMEDADQPFFLYHGTRGAHFDNYPNDDYLGRSRA